MLGTSRRCLLLTALAAPVLLAGAGAARAADDPLPSFNEGAAKAAILSFVEAATREGSEGFMPEAERAAVFDSDGTLWSEQPACFQFLFALDRAAALAAAAPGWASTPALEAAARGDVAGVMAGGTEALLEVVAATHSGMTVGEFTATAPDWLAEARHPETGRRYTEMAFRPMMELLDHLRAGGFGVCIVSGGGVDFLRAFAEDAEGVRPENVVGSMGGLAVEVVDGRPKDMKRPGIAFVDDAATKPAPSRATSAGGPPSSSATPTATSRCCNGAPRATARASASWSPHRRGARVRL